MGEMTRRPIAAFLMFAVLTVATYVWAQGAPAADATFRSPGGDHPLNVIQKGGLAFYSAEDVINGLGGHVTAESGGFRISLGTLQAAIGADSRFAVVKDDLIDMPQPPVISDGKVYLPMQ